MSDFLLANTNGNIQRSPDYGASWTTPYSGSRYVISFCDMGSGKILALSKTGYVLRSTDGGQNWADLGQKITETLYWEAEQNSRLVYLGNNSVLTIGGTGASKKVFKSTDSGDNWSTVDLTSQLATNGEHLICPVPGFVNGECFVSTVSNLVPGAGQRITNYMWRSTDYGSTWGAYTAAGSFGEGGIGGRRIKNTGDGYLVGIFWYKSNPSLGYYYGYRSKYNNSTATWSDAQLYGGAYQSVPIGDAVGAGGGIAIYSAANSPGGGTAYSSSPYSSWTSTTHLGVVSDFFYLGSYVFYCKIPGGSPGIYRSSSTGAPSWSQVNAAGADELLGFQYSSATADFTGTPTSGNANLSVQFTDTSTGATSWEWDFGDGSTLGTTQNPSHTYTIAGTYSVILSINSGASTKTRSDYVTVNMAAAFSGTPTSSFVSLPISFTDLSAGTPTTWDWDFGDGSPHSTTQNPTHVYSDVGTYTVTLIASRGSFTDTEIKSNFITISATADFVGTPTSGHIPLVVTFTDLSSGTPTAWEWNFGDGTSIIRKQNPRHYYMRPGTYTVSLTAFYGSTPYTVTKVGYITVPAYVLDFSGTPTSGTPPLAVQFTDESTGISPTFWSWSFGDGDTSPHQNPVHIYHRSGLYTVRMEIRSSL
jgi:PKD repeat protein